MQAQVPVKALKVTVVVPADKLPPLPESGPAVLFLVTPDQLIVTARLNPKSYRRALATIAQRGAENVAVLVQGQMTKASEIESAGIKSVVDTATRYGVAPFHAIHAVLTGKSVLHPA